MDGSAAVEYTKEDVQEKLNRISDAVRQKWTIAQTFEELGALGEILRTGIKGKRTPAKFKDSVSSAFDVLRTCIKNSIAVDISRIDDILALQDYLIQTPGITLTDVLLPAPFYGAGKDHYISAVTEKITSNISYILEFEDAEVLASLFSKMSSCNFPASVIGNSKIPEEFRKAVFSKVGSYIKHREIGSLFYDIHFIESARNKENVKELKKIAGHHYYPLILATPEAAYAIQTERTLEKQLFEVGDINKIADVNLDECLKLGDVGTTNELIHLGKQEILSQSVTESSVRKIQILIESLTNNGFSKAIEILQTLNDVDDTTLKTVLTGLQYPGRPDSLQEHLFATAFNSHDIKARIANAFGDDIDASRDEPISAAPELSTSPLKTFMSCKAALREDFSKHKYKVYEIAMSDPAVSYMLWRSVLTIANNKSISQEQINFSASMDFVWSHVGSDYTADRAVFLDDILAVYAITHNIGNLPISINQPMAFKSEHEYPQRFEFFDKIAAAGRPGLLLDFYKHTGTTSIVPALSKSKESWPLLDAILFDKTISNIEYLMPYCDPDYAHYLSEKINISFATVDSVHLRPDTPVKAFGIEPMAMDEDMKSSWELIRTSEKDMDALLDLFKHKLCSTNQLGLSKPDAAVDTEFTFNIM